MKMSTHYSTMWLEFFGDMVSLFAAYLMASVAFDAYTGFFAVFCSNLHFYIIAACSAAIVLYMLDAYGSIASYLSKRKRLSITLLVGLLLSAALTAVITLLFFRTRPVRFLFGAAFYLASYAIMMLQRGVTLRIFIRLRQKSALLILFPDGYPEIFLDKLMKHSEDFGSVAVYRIAENQPDIPEDLKTQINAADELLIASGISDALRDQLILYARQRGSFGKAPNIKVISSVENLSFLGGRITHVGDTPAIHIKNGQPMWVERVLKRCFDFVASLIGLIVLSPVFFICAAAIKIDSRGPVFYRQERYTIYRKRFYILKFRTMVADAEKYGARLATEKDDRITRVGHVLRACRLDELPQLINILKGEMSIVGPRPERPIYADEYSKMVKNFDIRYLVKAGLTGYAQVYGRYNTKVSDKVLLDSIYINTFSIWLDLKLIVLTILIMFTKESTEGVAENMAEVPVAKSEKPQTEQKKILYRS